MLALVNYVGFAANDGYFGDFPINACRYVSQGFVGFRWSRAFLFCCFRNGALTFRFFRHLFCYFVVFKNSSRLQRVRCEGVVHVTRVLRFRPVSGRACHEDVINGQISRSG